MTETFNVADAINAFLKRFLIEGLDKKVCGLFGYTAFDAVRYFEDIPVMEAHHEENDAPDMLYILYKYVLVFNHFKNELTLVELLQPGKSSNLQEIETLIENRNYASYNFQTIGPETSPISGEEYKAMVREGIRHCLRGDVFQIVLSRRFEQPFKETISRFTGPSGVSILPPICFISTSEGSVSSVPHLKHTVR